jgi:cyclophilin family peptidyl-prolyl cis-trans isomerase
VKRAIVCLCLLALPAAAEPRVGDLHVLLRTTLGDLVVALYPDSAPKHVAQVVRLVRLGVYDTTPIMRVQPEFVAQVSVVENRRVPLVPEQRTAIEELPLEIDPQLRHVRGALSMSHGSMEAGKTSFALVLADAPQLDGKYTIFGRVERGLDVLDAIAKVKTDVKHAPMQLLEIKEARIVTGPELEALVTSGPVAQSSNEAAPLQAILALLLMALIGIAVSLLVGKMTAKTVAALSLMGVLVGGVTLYSLLVPLSRASRLLSIVVFLGLVGMFRLMGRFENPE